MATRHVSTKQKFLSWFSGNVITNEGFIRRIPVLVYICILMLVYMAHGFKIQSRHAQVERLNASIKELRTVSFTTSAVRMQESRQTEVEKKLKTAGIDLVYNTEPPKLIKQKK